MTRAPVFGFAALGGRHRDAVLAVLLLRERRRAAPVRAYPLLLGVFVATQLPAFFLFRTPAWRAFAETIAK